MNTTYDICILGAGPGGYVAAIRGAQLGAEVALIEADHIGGTCLNWGCIPTKVYLKHAQIIHELGRIDSYGIKIASYEIDWKQMRERKNMVVQKMTRELESLLKANNITIIRGHGTLVSTKKIQVKTEDGFTEVEGEKIILATGSKPIRPKIKGIDLPGVITSRDALDLEDLPHNLLIIGGGVIGVEMATIFHSLGVITTIVEMEDSILPSFDREICQLLENSFKDQGIKILTDSEVKSIERKKGQLKVTMDRNSKEEVLEFEKVIVAIGREPNLQSMEGMDLLKNNAFIAVNPMLQTSKLGIYAIGDVTGQKLLAHVASAQGVIAVENALGENKSMDYAAIPSCVYSIPEVATVGLTEEEAQKKEYEVSIGRFPLAANGKSIAFGHSEGLVKVVTDKQWDQVLGIHCIGWGATDLIAEATLGLRLEVTSSFLAQVVHAHPTLSESIMEASMSVNGKPIHSY